MSSVWQFVKRHKGKMALGGAALAAGVYVYTEHRPLVQRCIDGVRGVAFGEQRHLAEPDFALQARRHFIFDSQQRAADDSIMQLVPDARGRILKQFDVAALTQDLRENAGVWSETEKIECWEKILVCTMGRIVCTSYTYSIIITVLKAQVSILSADIYAHSLSAQPIQRLQGLTDKLWSFVGYEQSGLDFEINSSSVDAQAQQLFLQCIQYFLTHGIASLADRVRTAARKCSENWSLKTRVSVAELGEMLKQVAQATVDGDCRNFSELVVPPSAVETTGFASAHTQRLSVLLQRLTAALQCHHARLLTPHCVDTFTRCACDFVQRRLPQRHDSTPSSSNNNNDKSSEAAVPLAKMLPLVADTFEHIVSDQFDRPVQEILISAELHQYCVKVFEGLGEG